MAETISANSATGWPPGPLKFTLENPAERRLEPVGQIALELTPGRTQPGPAMQVGHPRRVPGGLGTGLVGLPGPPWVGNHGWCVQAHRCSSFKVSVPTS